MENTIYKHLVVTKHVHTLWHLTRCECPLLYLWLGGCSCTENSKSRAERGMGEVILLQHQMKSLLLVLNTKEKKKVSCISCCCMRLEMPCLCMCWSYYFFFCSLNILVPSVKFLHGTSSGGANLPLVLSVLQQLFIFLLGVFQKDVCSDESLKNLQPGLGCSVQCWVERSLSLCQGTQRWKDSFLSAH